MGTLVAVQEEAVRPEELLDRLNLAIADLHINAQRLRETRDRLQESRARWQMSRSLREASHDNAYGRLLARFESQSVIEQAKGILIAEGGCSSDEAFEILRRASQRQNIRVRDLAAQIVKRASARRAAEHPQRPCENGQQGGLNPVRPRAHSRP